jgi:nitrogen regulatory protein PII-like uncharacterized protein
MKNLKNLAEELTESWSGFRYEDPYEKAVKIVEECDHAIRLCEWAKEIIGNLERKLKEKESVAESS